jgi:hypothetical protein
MDPILIEEKIDGSQFSFGLIDGQLRMKSKGQELHPGTNGMFEEALKTVEELKDKLTPGWTYRAEYLRKPKHNALAYNRIPSKCLIVFDINISEETYLDYDSKKLEAENLGLEVVPILFRGMVCDIEQLKNLLDRESILGGQKIEGFVIKNYERFDQSKKALMGKFVSEAYKEVHRSNWKIDNPTSKDIITQIGEDYRTPARWNKAIQHLKERGELKESPEDIGKLLKEVNIDILKECQDEIKQRLFKYAWEKISRISTRGLAQWYKDELLKNQKFSP